MKFGFQTQAKGGVPISFQNSKFGDCGYCKDIQLAMGPYSRHYKLLLLPVSFSSDCPFARPRCGCNWPQHILVLPLLLFSPCHSTSLACNWALHQPSCVLETIALQGEEPFTSYIFENYLLWSRGYSHIQSEEPIWSSFLFFKNICSVQDRVNNRLDMFL